MNAVLPAGLVARRGMASWWWKDKPRVPKGGKSNLEYLSGKVKGRVPKWESNSLSIPGHRWNLAENHGLRSHWRSTPDAAEWETARAMGNQAGGLVDIAWQLGTHSFLQRVSLPVLPAVEATVWKP